MNLIRRILNWSERRYLRKHIVALRPDLAGLPFLQQRNTYMRDTIRDYAERDENSLPELLERAVAYDHTRSRGHYAALYWLYREKYSTLLSESAEEALTTFELQIENSQARSALQQAVRMVTDVRNPDKRLN